MYNLEEMYVYILGTITTNVQSRRDVCRYTGHRRDILDTITKNVCRYTGHNNEKCTI